MVLMLRAVPADLERRVRELEALVTVAAPRTQDMQNWRGLRFGMTMDQVRTLLGEPERVDAGSRFTFWHWGDLAYVQFESRSGRLESWSEPRH
jgi:hypothetical protein